MLFVNCGIVQIGVIVSTSKIWSHQSLDVSAINDNGPDWRYLDLRVSEATSNGVRM
ncbi:hypothetical protein [Candidatus Palauibacter sp.]|uniref:hypothetical protein n=1 Tax=Candidatus Palauibacter sp. TaxID=3101350 RepID=UPI003B02C20F